MQVHDGYPSPHNRVRFGSYVIAVLVGILTNNSRLGDLRPHMDARFDDMRDTWRAELRRVEEVIDARWKHIEQR